jgi:biopolymer transport protein ExbD
MAGKVSKAAKGRPESGHNADINVTPFVDVMLVLLIIFMVSAPLATKAIKVDLPPVAPTIVPPKDPIFVSIDRSGISISGQPTTLRSLSGDLTRRYAVPNPQNQSVLIRADHEVAYADFMAVVNRLQADGFYKVALISEEVAS